mmetsp:Transcript_6542/g.10440  ORF Transcript_6542/g.10440 Transcript_6542/m.10440 type:complete len:126 (-) Transcript_6542:63-440(-)
MLSSFTFLIALVVPSIEPTIAATDILRRSRKQQQPVSGLAPAPAAEDPAVVMYAAQVGGAKVNDASDSLRKDAKDAVQKLEDLEEWKVDSKRMLWAVDGVRKSHDARASGLAAAFGLSMGPAPAS